ncbi:MAG: CDP-alcohol phosphatidyltransferase family protein [Candidatus Celaenobacter polaris]|nr:CDP-alcohol phosphatidyltransferase family protein [Candidatus Celaenobacter polaris]
MYTKKDGFARADFDPKTVITIPNIVTLIRLLILPFVLISLNNGQNIQAFILILVAGFTDTLDGFLAKVLHQSTTVGKILDPIVDKIFTVSILIHLYVYRDFPSWAFYSIIGLELAILIGGYQLIMKHHKIPSSNIPGKIAVIFVSLSIYLYVIDLDSINNFFTIGINVKILTVLIGVILLSIATVRYGIISKKEINKTTKTI